MTFSETEKKKKKQYAHEPNGVKLLMGNGSETLASSTHARLRLVSAVASTTLTPTPITTPTPTLPLTLKPMLIPRRTFQS